MREYALTVDEAAPESKLNRLREELVEAKFHREVLGLRVEVTGSASPSLALELVAILDFYGSGQLLEYRVQRQAYQIIRREICSDEIIIIDTPTIIEKDVRPGALLIVESSLVVAGEFGGTAVLRSYGSSIFATRYREAKVRTPRRDYLALTFGPREFCFSEAC